MKTHSLFTRYTSVTYGVAERLHGLSQTGSFTLHSVATSGVAALVNLDAQAPHVVLQTVDRLQQVLADVEAVDTTEKCASCVTTHHVLVQRTQLSTQTAIFELERVRSKSTNCHDVIDST